MPLVVEANKAAEDEAIKDAVDAVADIRDEVAADEVIKVEVTVEANRGQSPSLLDGIRAMHWHVCRKTNASKCGTFEKEGSPNGRSDPQALDSMLLASTAVLTHNTTHRRTNTSHTHCLPLP
jgi:hypothetical protein